MAKSHLALVAPATVIGTVEPSPSAAQTGAERSLAVHLHPGMRRTRCAWGAERRAAYEGSLLIALAVVLVAGSGLAIMNKACKSGHHAWCSQISSIRHHVKHS